MLFEALAWLTRRASPSARRMGYLHESIACEARARRCAEAWREHQTRCRERVLEAMGGLTERRRALLLGAGLTGDLPLRELSAGFERVVLLDMLFAPATRKLAARLGNVECLEHDLSGVVEAAANTEKHALPPKPLPALPKAAEGCDLIVSMNLLSQLPLLPAAWLRGHTDMSEDILHTWSRAVINAHIDLLNRQTGAVVLISDIAHIHRDANGRLLEREDRTFDAALPTCDTPWSWPLAPLGEIDRRTSVEARVCAWYKARGERTLRPWPGQA